MSEPKMISKANLIARKGWTWARVQKLIGEPDKILYRKDGSVAYYRFSLDRVEQAEKTTEFAEILASHKAEQLAKEEYRNDVHASLMHALEMDLRDMMVPSTGGLQMVLNAITEKCHTYNATKSKIQLEVFDPRVTNPSLQIVKLIAEKRPDLAFECGRYFERHYNLDPGGYYG